MYELSRWMSWIIPVVALAQQTAVDLHVIHVVDEQTRRGVPLAELCTTSNVCFVTDSQGLIALNEPAYWGEEVFFRVRSHGYEHTRDFFGDPGRTIRVTRGSQTTVKLTRINIAERLYRVTGEGIYRDSLLAGRAIPISRPALNAQVTGLDTVMHALYRGQIFWLFGDTDKLSTSLGNLATTCARSNLPSRGGLDPEHGINLDYFTGSNGFVKPMAAIRGDGLKWMFALMTLRDPAGVEKLVARYDRMKNLEEAYDSGLAVFDDRAQEFRPLVSFGKNPQLAPYGRPTRVSVNGREYFYFSSPHPSPVVRVPADWDSVRDLPKYEAFSCQGETCQWRRGAKPEKVHFFDLESGKRIDGTAGSVYWNAYRNRWIAIIQKNVGEVWFAEADTPVGPWCYARKIIEHDRYTFYWPGQIPYFDRDGGKRIYVMGTYTQSFSGDPVKTPRYDYNQIMYALSLDDPRLSLPVARYRVRGRTEKLRKEDIERLRLWNDVEGVADYAYLSGGGLPNARVLANPDHRAMFDRDAKPGKH